MRRYRGLKARRGKIFPAGLGSVTIEGPPFPDSPLDLRVELSLSGWTDISTYVYQRDGMAPPVRITRGRPGEQSSATPSSVEMQWNNRDGRFSPRNPVGAYYGLIGRNTPLRLSVPASANYLRFADDATSYASCPGLALSADIDIRVDMTLDNWAACFLAGQWGPTACWALTLNGDGTLRFTWNDNTVLNHVSSTVPIPFGRVAVRAYFDPSGTSGSSQVIFYTAPTMAGSWTQLGSAVAITASDFAHSTGSNPVKVGYSSGWDTGASGPTALVNYQSGLQGAVYEVQLYGAGVLVADPVFSSQAAGTTSFADFQGNTWTLNGTASISDRNYRAHAECTTLPQRWDPTGTDIWTPVAAKGLLRRIQQNNTPVPSVMRRAWSSLATTWGVLAYWPVEDNSGSAQIASGLPGGAAMAVQGTAAFQGTAGSRSADSGFACSAALGQVQSSTWTAAVPVTAASVSAGFSNTYFLLSVPSGGISGSPVLLSLATSDGHVMTFTYSSASGGTVTFAMDGGAGTPYTGVNGVPQMFILNANYNGVSAFGTVTTLQPGQVSSAAGTGSLSLVASTMAIRSVTVNPSGAALGATEIGHIAVACGTSSPSAFGAATGLPSGLAMVLGAWSGETAGNRFTRLCSENSIAGRVYGPPNATAVMGAQAIDRLANLLQQCEDADRGQIYEPREALSLGYRTLASMLQQPAALTLDYSLAQLGDGSSALEPEDDDQYTVNDMTVQRNGGSSAQVQVTSGVMSISAPPNGVGDYSGQLTVYTAYDAGLTDIAGWMTWTGTNNEERYPVIPLSLARSQLSSLQSSILAVRIGDYVQVKNLPTWLTYDPVKLLAYGWTESLGGYHWNIALNCVPESPYEVAVFDDATYGRADTDGSTLAAGVNSSATSLSVATTSGTAPLWTTAAADFPFDIAVGGERMTVTNITGASSPQAFTVTRAVNGVAKAQSSGADVRLWFPPIFSLT